MAGGIALIVAVLLGLAISRQITAPLQRITSAARRVAGGDFSQQVEVKSRDELATLAEAFNTMASTLARDEQQRKRLLSDIAHELRTPLSIVQGNLEAMVDGVVEATPQRLTSIREEVLLLNRLVTDLRDISVAESGHLQLHLEPVDVGGLIQAAASVAQAEAEGRGIEVVAHLAEKLPLVAADADRVAQVLRNLLSNALRYTPPGGVITLAATTTNEQPSESYQPSVISPQLARGQSALRPPTPFVLVTVTDTGSGMSSHLRAISRQSSAPSRPEGSPPPVPRPHLFW
ncbi:MAG: HAMP domain-containing protein [Bacteroidetes bacterium]|nr:HAMP domain-containing protein [Bacteroidota bacterium]